MLRPCEGYASLNGSLERSLQRARESFNLSTRRRFRDAHQRTLGQFRIRGTQGQRPDDFFAQELGIDDLYRARQLDREFVEERRVECAPDTGNLQQLGKRELRFGQVLFRHLAQAFLAEQRQVHRGGERAERLVRANVGGGLLPAEALFALREGLHQPTLAITIPPFTPAPPQPSPYKLYPPITTP